MFESEREGMLEFRDDSMEEERLRAWELVEEKLKHGVEMEPRGVEESEGQRLLRH